MTDKISELHEPFVEWVYDHSNDTPFGEVDVTEFGKLHSLDDEACWTLLKRCKERGFVDDKHSTMGTPAANLSGYGHEWVKARRRRRGDKVQRAIAARNGLLTWLWGQKQDGVDFPDVNDFRRTIGARFEGDVLSETEIDRAAATLKKSGLIDGVEVDQRRGPVRAETTNEGDRCVEQFSGDVMAYEQAKHKSGPTFNFGGDNKGNVSAGDGNTLNSTVTEADTAAKIMNVVEQYRQAKPTISLPAEVEAEVVETMDELEREVNSSTPDVGRIRRGLLRVGEHLNMAAAGALGNLIAVGALELAASLG